jgi:hypothetical protein
VSADPSRLGHSPSLKVTNLMAEPMRSTRSALGVEFNAFLFAPVFDDKAELPLSVVSALARLDLDPWQEAADLAQLPSETARRRLASLLARLPGGPSVHPDLEGVAPRLIALLPRPEKPQNTVRAGNLPFRAVNHTAFTTIILVIYMLASLALLNTMSQRGPAQAHAPDPRPASSPMPAPNVGQ